MLQPSFPIQNQVADDNCFRSTCSKVQVLRVSTSASQGTLLPIIFTIWHAVHDFIKGRDGFFTRHSRHRLVTYI